MAGGGFSFVERSGDRGLVLFLKKKGFLSIVNEGAVRLGKRREEFERIYYDTPKGDLIKKGCFFYEERAGRDRHFAFLEGPEKSRFASVPEELGDDLFPYLTIKGNRRKGRARLKDGASASVEHLYGLRAFNPSAGKSAALGECFELQLLNGGDIRDVVPGAGAEDGFGFAALFEKLEVPFVHDPAKSGFAIGENDDCGTALRKLMRKELHRIRGFAHFVKAGSNPEYLHEMRVATRRLRSYLRIFPDVLGEKRSASLGLAASSFGVDLGRLRDLDVFLEKLKGWLAETGRPESDFARFSAPFSKSAAEEAEIISGLVGSARYRDFAARIENLSREKEAGNTFSRGSFFDASFKAMKLYRSEAGKRARKYLAAPNPQALHRVRIAFKRYRYLFESLEQFYEADGKGYRSYRKALVEIQDALGNYQDARVAERLINEALEATEDKETLVAFGALKQLLKTKQSEEEKKFLKRFREFRKMKEPGIIKGG